MVVFIVVAKVFVMVLVAFVILALKALIVQAFLHAHFHVLTMVPIVLVMVLVQIIYAFVPMDTRVLHVMSLHRLHHLIVLK